MDFFEIAKQSFVGGLYLLQENNLEGAEAQFARALEILPGRVSTLNNLAGVKIRLHKFAEAEAFARQVIALEEQSPEAWSNLGIVLSKTGRREEALRAYDRALDGNSAFIRAWLGKAEALLELKRYDEALRACDEALKRDPNQHEALHTKSLALHELERPVEARKVHVAALARRVASSPVFMADRRATQKADALIISPDPCLGESLKSFETLHLECPNFPGQLARRLHADFHFTFVFEGDAASDLAREQIPQPDFVLNNCVNGEAILARGSLPGLTKLVDSFGVPVVNHPAKAVPTARDTLAERLVDIPGVLVPKTMRFSALGKTSEQLVAEIEAQFDYPLITRTLTAQKGVGMDKADSREALVGMLAAGLPENFFVTEFVDSRKGNEFHRKLRAAIVQDEIVVVRVDYHPNWKVHGGRSGLRVAFYLEHPQLLDQEKRICADPEKELGRSATQSLRAIRERIPLDVFGVDFEVDADGRLVFYEANATMNLLTSAQKEVPNPTGADEHLKQAFRRYFASLAGRY